MDSGWVLPSPATRFPVPPLLCNANCYWCCGLDADAGSAEDASVAVDSMRGKDVSPRLAMPLFSSMVACMDASLFFRTAGRYLVRRCIRHKRADGAHQRGHQRKRCQGCEHRRWSTTECGRWVRANLLPPAGGDCASGPLRCRCSQIRLHLRTSVPWRAALLHPWVRA